MKKVALVTGITGQDGAYLTELLLSKGYEVHGIKRRSSLFNTDRIDHLYQDPHETNKRLLGLIKKTRVYQASTSELYGLVQAVPQSETTPFYPRSPYAVAKLYAYWITVNYREAYKMYATNGILFNHESPLRGETFVTRKITRGVAKIGLGLQDKIFLGNLDARRDWGHAKDYVEAMWRILQQPEPEDYVIATGVTTPVREFVRMAFAQIGVELEFRGKAEKEVAVVAASTNPDFMVPVGKEVVSVDPKYYRPTEVDLLIGDPTKAQQKLGWTPTYDLPMLVKDMMNSDIQLFRKERTLRDSGFYVKNQYE